MTNVEKALEEFGNAVSKDAKRKLKALGKDASGRLSKSMNYYVKGHQNSFTFSLEMEDYGKFVDKGVKGIGGERKKKNAKGQKTWKKKKVVSSSPFSYKEGIQNKPSRKHFDQWTIRKAIAPRSKGGQFQKRRGLLFAIATSVYHTGLETTYFLTAPFEKYFRDLPDDLTEAYALDVEQFLEHTLK